MKKYLLLLVAALSSCTTTKEEIVISNNSDQTDYSISVQEAIDNLNKELKFIDGADSRSQTRAIKSIKSIKSRNSLTRNTEGNDLLYIVEFDNRQGSAVISADQRIKPVLAVLDNTVITEQNFNSDDMSDIGNYMASLIKDYAEYQVQESKASTLPPYKPPKIDTIYNRKQAPLTRTKWGQGFPYNKLCISKSGESVPAGCVAIATAQLLEFHKHPSNVSINKQTFDWNLIEQYEYGKNPSVDAQDEIARFVYNIGKVLGINYAGGQYTAKMDKAVSLLKNTGYKSVKNVKYKLETVRNFVYNNHYPIIISGIHKGSKIGHAWILDGLNEYSVRSIQYLVGGGTMDRTITSNKIHCNFGWSGYCDGYYDTEVFDTTKKLNSVDIDESIGDRPYSNNNTEYNYNSDLHLITYSL